MSACSATADVVTPGRVDHRHACCRGGRACRRCRGRPRTAPPRPDRGARRSTRRSTCPRPRVTTARTPAPYDRGSKAARSSTSSTSSAASRMRCASGWTVSRRRITSAGQLDRKFMFDRASTKSSSKIASSTGWSASHDSSMRLPDGIADEDLHHTARQPAHLAPRRRLDDVESARPLEHAVEVVEPQAEV